MKYYANPGASVYIQDNGKILEGIYCVTQNGYRWKMGGDNNRARHTGAWEADHDAYVLVSPSSTTYWSKEDESA